MVLLGSNVLLHNHHARVNYCSISISFFDDKHSDDSGKTYGFFMTGQIVFVTIIVAANLKFFSFTNSYSLIFVILIVLSSSLGYVTWLVVNYFDLGNLEHTFYRVLGTSTYYLYTFIVLTVCAIDWASTKLYRKLPV